MFARVTLTPTEMTALAHRRSPGDGGFQRLQRELLDCTVDATTLVIPTERLARRICAYVNDYGAGGFQGRLKPLAAQLRPLLPALPTQADLFDEKDE